MNPTKFEVFQAWFKTLPGTEMFTAEQIKAEWERLWPELAKTDEAGLYASVAEQLGMGVRRIVYRPNGDKGIYAIEPEGQPWRAVAVVEGEVLAKFICDKWNSREVK